MRRFPSTSLTTGSCPSATPAEKTNPDHSYGGLADVRRVLRERREQLAHEGDPTPDEDHVQDDECDEDSIPEDVLVAPGLVVRLAVARRGEELQNHDEGEERHGVQQEEERERARIVRPRDRARDQSAEREADVHRHALLRKRSVAASDRRQRAE
jgi:hypothetical protein